MYKVKMINRGFVGALAPSKTDPLKNPSIIHPTRVIHIYPQPWRWLESDRGQKESPRHGEVADLGEMLPAPANGATEEEGGRDRAPAHATTACLAGDDARGRARARSGRHRRSLGQRGCDVARVIEVT